MNISRQIDLILSEEFDVVVCIFFAFLIRYYGSVFYVQSVRTISWIFPNVKHADINVQYGNILETNGKLVK